MLLRIYFILQFFFNFFWLILSLLSFNRLSKYFPSFLFLVDFTNFTVIYWLLLSLQIFFNIFHFCRLLPSFTAVNRKFLYTDFQLLLTSVKIENFTDFYRSQKKNWKTPVLRKHSSLYKKRLVSRINPNLLLKINLQNTWTLQLNNINQIKSK